MRPATEVGLPAVACPTSAKTSARNRPSRAGRCAVAARDHPPQLYTRDIRCRVIRSRVVLDIDNIQSMLWRGTNRNHQQREVVDERADSFIAKGRLPCDDGVQSADRRARNLGEAAGAPPITPAKSGYSAASKAHPRSELGSNTLRHTVRRPLGSERNRHSSPSGDGRSVPRSHGSAFFGAATRRSGGRPERDQPAACCSSHSSTSSKGSARSTG